MKKLLAIVGTRPQYVKHAAIEMAMTHFRKKITLDWIDTGQHYDAELSTFFKSEFSLTKPVENFSFDQMISKHIGNAIKIRQPDLVLVYGDTNSTKIAADCAALQSVPVAHIEAGLRSFNLEMPEERNRVAVDKISDLLFAPSQTAIDNLRNESVHGKVYLSGDVMYSMIDAFKLKSHSFSSDDEFLYLSLHRPYNVDNIHRLTYILEHINDLGFEVKFPCHPRTLKHLEVHKTDLREFHNINFLKPQSYIANLKLLKSAQRILTDSGGLQKEAYWLKKPCITIRSETEWIETLHGNWNQLIFEPLGNLKHLIKIEPKESDYKQKLYATSNPAKMIIEKIQEYLYN